MLENNNECFKQKFLYQKLRNLTKKLSCSRGAEKLKEKIWNVEYDLKYQQF